MEKLKTKNYGKKGPEHKIQEAIIKMLRYKEWYVKVMVGNAYQFGIPDLWASHHRYGPRWIEVKLPGMKGSRFTAAQLEDFPKICANGSGVWVLTGATEEEYRKLFRAPNWHVYLNIMKG